MGGGPIGKKREAAMDIVQQLRRFSLARSGELHPNKDGQMADEAADEIERLRAALRNIIAGNGGECGCAETARAALAHQ